MGLLQSAFRVYSTDTAAKIVVVSAKNSTPVIAGVNVNSPSAVQVGTDSGVGGVTDSGGAQAVFSWTFTVSDTLVQNTDYPITVTHDGITANGTIRTQQDSSSEEDFTLFFISCDGHHNQTETTAKGCWGYIHDTALVENVRSVIHVDDHGYVDGTMTEITSKDAYGDALYSLSATTEYHFAVGYAAYMGLIDFATHGHDVDRQWCHNNINMICGVGDHEMEDNAEDKDNIDATWNGNAKDAFMKTIGAGQTYLAGGFADMVVNLGPIELIIYDRIFALTPSTKVYDNGDAVQASEGVDWLGDTQINEIIAAVDSSSPFKMLGMSTDAYHFMDQIDRKAALSVAGLAPDLGNAWTFSSTLGGQQPLHDYTDALVKSEWAKLMYDKATAGIANIAESYGGVVFGCHGDMHRPTVKYHYVPQDADNSQLSMYQFGSGSVDKRVAQALHPAVIKGTSRLGSHMMYIPPWVKRTDGTGIGVNSCIRLDVSKASGSWEIDVNILEVDDETNVATSVYQQTLKHGQSNSPEHLRKGWG